MNGTIPKSPRMTKRVPLKTLYLGLSNLGHKDTQNTATQHTDIEIIYKFLHTIKMVIFLEHYILTV